jgi:large subunit ribosomal protein L24
MKLREGDKVKVIAGKYKGVSNPIEKLYKDKNTVLLKDVNIVVRHIKKQGDNEGGRIKVERPIDISKVMLVCPNCNKTTRIGYKITAGKKTRVCKKCKKTI